MVTASFDILYPTQSITSIQLNKWQDKWQRNVCCLQVILPRNH